MTDEPQQWTTELPTESGWYWLAWSADTGSTNPRLAEVHTGPWYCALHGLSFCMTEDRIPAGAHWLGPIAVPEPPEEK